MRNQIVAALAAVAVVATAGGAAAGTSFNVSGAPNPSTVGQNVTLTATIGGTPCTAPVDFVDITNASAPLCQANFTSNNIASCTVAFGTAGVRTVRGTIAASGAMDACQLGLNDDDVQTVNAAVVAVPTLSEWALWGFAGLMLLVGAGMAARRLRATAGHDDLSAG